jgi:hypothetical protein
MFFGASAGNPVGINTAQDLFHGYNVSGDPQPKGAVLQFDLGLVHATTTNLIMGNANSGWARLISPLATNDAFVGFYALAFEDIPDGQKGVFMLRGISDGIFTAAETSRTGQDLFYAAVTDDLTDQAVSTTQKAVARMLVAATITEAAGEVAPVVFNGIEGINPGVVVLGA